MTPEEMIADLDASLATDGEEVILQRLTLAAGGIQIPLSVRLRAFVRRYRPDELIGTITQQDSKVILSPTQIIRDGWTSGRPAHEDARVPVNGNRVIIQGRPRKVEAADGIYPAGELVRIEMLVKGQA